MRIKKPRKPPAAQPAGRVKKTVILPAETARMLAIYAASLGQDQSAVVAEALQPVLAGYYLARKPCGSLTPTGPADPPALSVPTG